MASWEARLQSTQESLAFSQEETQQANQGIRIGLENVSTESELLAIYGAYPRRVGRRVALLEIERALRRLTGGELGRKLPHHEAVSELTKVTTLFASSPAGQRGNFTPHPATWFHQSRYLDNPDEWFHQTEEERLRALNNVGVSQWRPA